MQATDFTPIDAVTGQRYYALFVIVIERRVILWVPSNPSEQLTRRVDTRERDRRACRAVATGLDPDRRCGACQPF
jgi:hypothetical protein